MSEQIEPGDGWRLIDKQKDTKRPGDEYWSCFGEWATASNDGMFHSEHVYRRRIQAKPEETEIDGHRVSLEWGFVRIGSLFSHYYFSSRTEAIRQLGEWCIAVADWREAHDAGK
jgi:uncharacterized protein (DUF2237 family)